MLFHHSCLLLAAEIWGAAVSAGHRDTRRLAPHVGSLGWYRDRRRVLLLSKKMEGTKSGGMDDVLTLMFTIISTPDVIVWI